MLSAPLYSDIFVYIGKNLCYDTKGYKPKVYASLIVNVLQIERVRSTEQSGRYHNNPEKKKEK